MHPGRTFLEDLAVVMCVAAATTVVFRRLRQPVVLGYLLAGLIVGPYIPLPLFADADRIHALSELGVILLMFSIGLEFSFRKLARVGLPATLVGTFQIAALFGLGYAAAEAFGWTPLERLYTGAMVAISSTMIIARAFAEQRVRGPLADLVIGILIVEDLAAVLLIATLTALSAGTVAGGTVVAVAAAAGKLLAFLVVLVVAGFLVVPRTVRFVARLREPETLLVASIGICFGTALVAQKVGYSVALGAFLAGNLIAESGVATQVEHLVRPLRDMFAAVFFIAVGMLIDPRILVTGWPAVAVLTGIVLAGKVVAVALGSFLAGTGVRTAVQAGMSMAQIGEFSFIIAGTGFAAGAVGPHLYPTAVAVCVVTTFTTPWLIRGSGAAAVALERRLPRPLQTFAALYGSWLEQVRAPATPAARRGRVRRYATLLLVDAAVLIAIAVAAWLGLEPTAAALDRTLDLGPSASRWLIGGAALLASVPFLAGIFQTGRALAGALALRALPAAPAGTADLAAAPRRALAVAFHLAAVLLVLVPLVVVTRPFLPVPIGVGLLAVAAATLGIALWRSAENLESHVRAGAELVVEALALQAAGTSPVAGFDEVRTLLPGLGDVTPVTLGPASHAVGRTLADLELRALTGATVIAIRRGEEGVVVPTGAETLAAGDTLVLAGGEQAVRSARALLERGPRPSSDDA